MIIFLEHHSSQDERCSLLDDTKSWHTLTSAVPYPIKIKWIMTLNLEGNETRDVHRSQDWIVSYTWGHVWLNIRIVSTRNREEEQLQFGFNHTASPSLFPHLHSGSIHSYLPFLTEIIVRLRWEGRKCRGQIRNEQLKGTREGSRCRLCLIPALLVPVLKRIDIQNHYAV